MIPRTVHRIWFGPHPMPDEYKAYREKWESFGYEVTDWTENDLPVLRNRDVYDDPNIGASTGGGIAELGVWVQRADVVSYELIWRYGGIYANTDIEPLRPFDDLLDGVSAFAGIEQEHFLGNAVMGCEAGHPFFDRVIEVLPGRYFSMVGVPMNGTTGPHLLTAVASERDDLTVFPAETFYPYLYSEMDREHGEHPDAYTAHHWGHTRGLGYFIGDQ